MWNTSVKRSDGSMYCESTPRWVDSQLSVSKKRSLKKDSFFVEKAKKKTTWGQEEQDDLSKVRPFFSGTQYLTQFDLGLVKSLSH